MQEFTAKETRRQACAMVEAMVALARALGMRTVAEGIENEAQFVLVKEIGCDAVQGCFIGKPGSAARIDPLPRPGLKLSYTTRDINDDATRWLAKAAAPARTGQKPPVEVDIHFDQPRSPSPHSMAALRRANCRGHSLNRPSSVVDYRCHNGMQTSSGLPQEIDVRVFEAALRSRSTFRRAVH